MDSRSVVVDVVSSFWKKKVSSFRRMPESSLSNRDVEKKECLGWTREEEQRERKAPEFEVIDSNVWRGGLETCCFGGGLLYCWKRRDNIFLNNRVRP